MTTPLLLTVASGLAWGALDALRKSLAARVGPLALAALLALGQWPLFLLWLAGSGEVRIAPGYFLPGGLTVLLNSAAASLYLKAVHASPLSVTIPFLSFTPVFSTILSAAVLGERPRAAQAAGIALVAAGALIVNLRSGSGTPLAALLRERGSLMMVGVALIWSLTAVMDKRALGFAAPALHASVQTAGVALVLLVALGALGSLGELKAASAVKGSYALALLLSGAALGSQFLALRLTLVGVFEAVKRSIGMLVAVAVGRLVFREPVSAGKLAGVALMSAGVALLVT